MQKNANVNKNVIGKMKNELDKGHMSEFIALSLKFMLISRFLLIKHFQKMKKLEAQVRRLQKRP